MARFKHLGLIIVLAATMAIGFGPVGASAQMVPDTVDPYELAPINAHLYPISLNARIPYYYLPPIFAPARGWGFGPALTVVEFHDSDLPSQYLH